jgi:hypothetical protein
MNAFEDTMEMLTKEGNKIMADAHFASDKVTEIITTLINEKGSNSVIGILRECVRELDRLWED